jgi:ATP-dependent DNA helicase RecG
VIDIASLDLDTLPLNELLDIASLAKENESEVVELKNNVIKSSEISDYITQFANNRGGLLILGLWDDGKPSGKITHFDKSTEIAILNGDLETYPSVGIQIKSFKIPGEDCYAVVIKIPKPNDGVQRISSNGSSIKRVGSRRAVIQPIGYSYERQILVHSNLEDLDPHLIKQFIFKLKTKVINISGDDNSILVTFQLLQLDDSKVPHPTIAGMILFGKSPDVLVSGTRVNIIRYATLEKSNKIEESAVITGPILKTIEETNDKVWSLIRKSDYLISGKRNEISEYPRTALREAISNAFFHNDYRIPGNIFIEIYPDRLEIKNMGVPLGGTRLSDLIAKPKHRNPVLLKVLSEMGFVEGWGIGLKTIVDNLRMSGLPEPKLTVSNEETCLCFRTHSFLDKETLAWISDITSKLTTEYNFHQIVALAYVRHKGKITNGIYQSINGVTTHVAGNELRSLCSSGLFISLGRGKSAYYSLAQLFDTNEVRLGKYFPTDIIVSLRGPQRKILSLVNTFAKINAKQIFYQSGYGDERGVKRILNGLVKLHLLKRIAKNQSDPNAYYEINKEFKNKTKPEKLINIIPKQQLSLDDLLNKNNQIKLDK